MARRGLLQKIQPKDADLARVQANVFDAVETLAKDHDVISANVVTAVGSANLPPGASMVAYVGGPGQTLTLPPANCQGKSVGFAILLLNVSPNAVTVVPSRGDAVNAATSLAVASSKLCLLASDGISKWLGNL